MSEGDLISEMKKSLYQIMIGDQALQALIKGRTYTFIPQDTEFPYVRACNISTGDGGTKSSPGQIVTISIDIFSRERSDLELDMIKKRLYALLHEKQPPIEGGSTSLCRFLSSLYGPESDGITRHVVARFRLTYYEDQSP